jgi:hypothetical protein
MRYHARASATVNTTLDPSFETGQQASRAADLPAVLRIASPPRWSQRSIAAASAPEQQQQGTKTTMHERRLKLKHTAAHSTGRSTAS